MKKIIILVGMLVIYGSCRNEELYPLPDPEWAPVAEIQWTDKDKTFFNYANLANAAFEFTLIGEDFGYEEAEVASIEVSVVYNNGDETLLGEFNNLPATVTVPATEAASLFNMDVADLQLGDVFTFSFVVKSVDGRVFSVYNNNICNLIRIAVACTLDAFILNPTVALASVSSANNAFNVTEITASGDDMYSFTLDKMDFTTTYPANAQVELSWVKGTEVTEWKTLKTIADFPSEVSITASEAAALFEKTTADLEAGDQFEVRFVFESESIRFNNYGSRACGVNFPSNVVFPQHLNATGEIPNLSWDNPYGASTAPATTSTSGTCALTIDII